MVLRHTLKKGLWSSCLPPLTMGSSYSYCLCNASGSPFTRAARALPVKLYKTFPACYMLRLFNSLIHFRQAKIYKHMSMYMWMNWPLGEALLHRLLKAGWYWSTGHIQWSEVCATSAGPTCDDRPLITQTNTKHYNHYKFWKLRLHLVSCSILLPKALSWAQAASEAANLGTMLRFEAKLRRKSSRHVTRSIEGQERMERSDRRSLGPREDRRSIIL